MTTRWWTRAVIGRTAVSDPLRDVERPDAQFEAAWRSLIKSRLKVMIAVLAVWGVVVEARLVQLQVFRHDYYAGTAREQQIDVLEPDAPRGDIRDRNGQLLAYSIDSEALHADPAIVRDPVAATREICALLGDCSAREQEQFVAKLSKKTSAAGKPIRGVELRPARLMSHDAAVRVRQFIDARKEVRTKDKKRELPPWFLRSAIVRYYPKLNLGAHLIGFVNGDGEGGAGIERRFDQQIAGTKGRVVAHRDANGNSFLEQVERAPVQGASVELTIDLHLQHMAERELKAGIDAAGALAGSAVVLDPHTGEILALANYPTFNPNRFNEASDDQRRNRAVQDIYEPGSTFKIVTASAALNENVLSAATLIDTNPGLIRIGNRKPITEAKGHNYHVLSFEDVIVKSSNVGAVKAGLQIGGDRLMRYVRGFGFGQLLAPDFKGEGESRGIVTDSTPDDSAIASISMGYEIGVTPIQIATAASVVANGGLLVQPHLLRAVITNGSRHEVKPNVMRRVISPATAMTLTSIMEGVVERGTGDTAALGRYLVAGKTGTAKKAIRGGYSETDYWVSFVGFVPSRDPVYTILVVIDRPTKLAKYGGVVAGPVFQRIADAALQYAGVMPSIDPAPPIMVPQPRTVAPVPPRPEAPPVMTNIGGATVMPDLRGLTLRQALRRTSAIGMRLSSDGDGVVVSQSPAAGTPIAPANRGTVQLRRVPAPPPGGGDR